MRRYATELERVSWFVALGWMAVCVVAVLAGLSLVWWWAAAVVGVFGVGIFARARATRFIRRSQYSLCIHCRYDLSAGDPTGDCPECGVPYELEHTRAEWENQYRYLFDGREL